MKDNREKLPQINEKSVLFGTDFAPVKKILSSEKSWISAVQRNSGNINYWIRTETALVGADNSLITGDQH